MRSDFQFESRLIISNIYIPTDRSYNTYIDLVEKPELCRRFLAELKYKIGLCQASINEYGESVDSMEEACKYLDDEIDEISKRDVPKDKKDGIIEDLTETKQEIMIKIQEISQIKTDSVLEMRQKMQEMMGDGSSDAGAGSSSSSGVAASSSSSAAAAAAIVVPPIEFGEPGPSTKANIKTPPTNISHLIKRKQTDQLSPPQPAKKVNQ